MTSDAVDRDLSLTATVSSRGQGIMTTTQEPASDLAQFDRKLDELHLRGQWQYDAQLVQLTDGPVPAGVPFRWSWELADRALTEMCTAVSGETARRNFTFINPAPDVNGTTQTLAMGMQITLPGEIAPAHRHSINALRFVVDGSPDLFTAVDGEKLAMEDGDLIITPAYSWHDHHNESDKRGVWVDILDVPLMGYLRQMFFEPFGGRTQPLHEDAAAFTSSRASHIRPAWEARQGERIPFRYAWSEVRAALDTHRHSSGSPFDGVILHYAHPISGGPTLPTIDCFAQLLRPGLCTERHRHTSSAVYYVVEGEGTTVVGDEEIQWSAGDSFVVPNWMWHAHMNRSSEVDAVLFSATDAPMLEALGMYREEPRHSFGTQPYPAVPGDLASPAKKRV
ncbi:cupin domain-containing protein [Mycobacterium intracellulare]|uniref:Cupin domain-containing protein n=1 Tax=Mycobacterium intracellulare TaxID=1767 RepID=A0AAE4UCT2_MYCIT|nr:cupin domain-containing protein [Mycobacterium intracellulare]MDV6976874.1 cupin domain-containing protein [Mycobacterium intracellulare]MDV6982171.1 cupin domain-containing protein [Mycobacterium intracellulare]MDV7012044.1 cupin domain-containing protein [Mycobacterium intracellulare]MDV7026980.1 cupin domain-containing protein [Mycobacterium intracellulare]